MAALFERPVVIKPPEVVASHDFLLIGWILLLLMGAPWIGLAIDALTVGVMGYTGYAPAAIVTMLATGSWFIDSWTSYFAFGFTPIMTLAIGAGAVAFFLIVIGTIYFTTVRRTSTGNYEGARAASLFYGVIMILISLGSFAAFLGYTYFASVALLILPALFFLMGYGKMGEVIARYGPMAVLSDSAPIETMSHIPSGAAAPAIPVMAAPAMGMGGPVMAAPAMGMGGPVMAAPAMGMGGVAVPSGAVAMPAQPSFSSYQHLGGAVPRVPLCPTCGRELYYASNYKRWYCLACESRR